LINAILLAAQATIPSTPTWSFKVAAVMILTNILALAIVRYATQERGSKPPSPIPGFGVPQLLAATSFGHILGAGIILGLGSSGVL